MHIFIYIYMYFYMYIYLNIYIYSHHTLCLYISYIYRDLSDLLHVTEASPTPLNITSDALGMHIYMIYTEMFMCTYMYI